MAAAANTARDRLLEFFQDRNATLAQSAGKDMAWWEVFVRRWFSPDAVVRRQFKDGPLSPHTLSPQNPQQGPTDMTFDTLAAWLHAEAAGAGARSHMLCLAGRPEEVALQDGVLLRCMDAAEMIRYQEGNATLLGGTLTVFFNLGWHIAFYELEVVHYDQLALARTCLPDLTRLVLTMDQLMTQANNSLRKLQGMAPSPDIHGGADGGDVSMGPADPLTREAFDAARKATDALNLASHALTRVTEGMGAPAATEWAVFRRVQRLGTVVELVDGMNGIAQAAGAGAGVDPMALQQWAAATASAAPGLPSNSPLLAGGPAPQHQQHGMDLHLASAAAAAAAAAGVKPALMTSLAFTSSGPPPALLPLGSLGGAPLSGGLAMPPGGLAQQPLIKSLGLEEASLFGGAGTSGALARLGPILPPPGGDVGHMAGRGVGP